MTNPTTLIDPDILALAKDLDLMDAEDRATFRTRVAHLYRNADHRKIKPRAVADAAIAALITKGPNGEPTR